MNFITRQIPNSITCINILSGTAAIICAGHGYEPFWGLNGIWWAYIFIGIAAVADFCDGMAARLLKAYSDLGKELDSLCDCVSFGVAPAVILAKTLQTGSDYPWLGWCALLIAAAGAVRLARFNIDTRQATSFIGLPIPANAIFWIGYTAMAAGGAAFLYTPWVFLPVLLVECWLMNSPLPIFSLKFKHLHWQGNQVRYVLALAAVALVCWLGVSGLLWLIIVYVLLSLLPVSRK